MNIAMLTNNYKPFIAGVPVSVERLSRGLRRLGHRVTVFAPEMEGAEMEKDVVRFRVLYRMEDKGIIVGNCFDKKLEACFRKEAFDLIHVHHPVIMGQTALRLGRKYNIPVAYTYHTRYEEYLHHFKIYENMAASLSPAGRIARLGKEKLIPAFITSFSNQCDLVFAPTAMMEKHLLSQGVTTGIYVLPTGLEETVFQRDEACLGMIRSMYAEACPCVFATTARLEKEKNLDFLFHAAAHLKEILGEGFRLMVIGEGTQRGHLEDLARSLGIGPQVVFTGRVPNDQVRHYMHAADAFLFASKTETQGIVLLEAMAAGCPVTAVTANGVVDVVSQGVNGYMTEENPVLFAEAAAGMVLDRNSYLKMSKAAKATAASYESLHLAAMAAEQYRILIKRREETGRKGYGKGIPIYLVTTPLTRYNGIMSK